MFWVGSLVGARARDRRSGARRSRCLGADPLGQRRRRDSRQPRRDARPAVAPAPRLVPRPAADGGRARRARARWPVWLIALANVFAGIGLSVHLTLWFTRLPARDPRAGAVPRELLRRARLVRADAGRVRARRPALGRDRDRPRRCGSASVIFLDDRPLILVACPSVRAHPRPRRPTTPPAPTLP